MTFGLSNFGSPLESNICYINAILQLLHSLALIRNLVKRKGYKANPDSVTPVLDEISRIFKYEGPVTSAGPLRLLLGAKEGLEYVMSGEQEDASRFLQHLLENIFKEMDPKIELEKMITMSVTHQRCFNSPNGSCTHCGYTLQPRDDSWKVLMLHESTECGSLQNMLENYFKDRAIEIRCSNDGHCKDADSKIMKEGFEKQLVTEIPEILFVQVPKAVNVKSDEGHFYVQDVKYEIVGVVDHLGPSVNQGHWIAWSKLESQWYKCDDRTVEPDMDDSHFSSNNYIFAGVRCEPDEDKERCASCQKSFSNLLMHLRKASNCQVFYDLEAMKEKQAARSSEKRQQQKSLRKAKQSEQDKALANLKDAERKKKSRKDLSDEKKARENEAAAKRMQKRRTNQSEEEKARVNEVEAKRMEKKRKNQS